MFVCSDLFDIELIQLDMFDIDLFPMMHGYFKLGNVSYRVVFDTSIFIYKVRVGSISRACPCHIHPVSRHHRLFQLDPFTNGLFGMSDLIGKKKKKLLVT